MKRFAFALLAGAGLVSLGHPQPAHPAGSLRPNIVFVLMDNLGYGEPGVYGGGVLRGTPTPRIVASRR